MPPSPAPSDLGRIGLLERENAGLLNAALADLARDTIAAFEKAIRDSGIAAPLFITQNDGTVAEARQARRLPVYSFASGATNSMRGAAYLSGLADAMVIDVGGTTTDVGQLKHGFPREANSVVKVGGVRTLFRMPDLLSIGLGGGSHVALDPLKVGPVSVGYRLLKDGIAFGGEQLTTTDIAVASGVLELGDRKKVAHLDEATCQKVFAEAARMAEEAIDRMKTEAGDVPLIAVGGGAFLIPDKLPGVSRVIHVEHGDCANAVGAAIAQVSGECDQIFKDMSRRDAIAAAQGIANDRAVAAGADRKTLATIESEDMPLAYLPGNSVRVRVRVVGDVAACLNPRPAIQRPDRVRQPKRENTMKSIRCCSPWPRPPGLLRLGAGPGRAEPAARSMGHELQHRAGSRLHRVGHDRRRARQPVGHLPDRELLGGLHHAHRGGRRPGPAGQHAGRPMALRVDDHLHRRRMFLRTGQVERPPAGDAARLASSPSRSPRATMAWSAL